MTTIKRTVKTFYAVVADTPVDRLSECYVHMHEQDLSAHGMPTIAVVDVEIEIDVDKFIADTLTSLDKSEATLRAEFQKKLDQIQSTRANLLSLPAPSASIPQPDVLDFVRATLDPAEAEERYLTDVFYVTYGGNTWQHNNFSRVFALDYGSARELIFEKIGDKFAFCYTEAGFAGQIEGYGLTEIPLTAHVVSPF